MLIRIRRHATFSNIVALLALFFALGGTVYAAGKFSGKQIKPNSLPGNRVKANTLTGKQLKETAVTGVASANALSGVTYVSQTVSLPNPPGTTVTATATCPTGLKAVGGGFSVGATNGFIDDGTVTADRTGYTAHVEPGTTSGNGTITVACIAASTSTG
jgi:hypothetical protein